MFTGIQQFHNLLVRFSGLFDLSALNDLAELLLKMINKVDIPLRRLSKNLT